MRLRGIPESRGPHRYAPGKWSVKEVVLHLADTERIMTYRALRIARHGYDAAAGIRREPLHAGVRGRRCSTRGPGRGSVMSAKRPWTCSAIFRRRPGRGAAPRQAAISVRALAWIIAGHERHHLGMLEERYGSGRRGRPEASPVERGEIPDEYQLAAAPFARPAAKVSTRWRARRGPSYIVAHVQPLRRTDVLVRQRHLDIPYATQGEALPSGMSRAAVHQLRTPLGPGRGSSWPARSIGWSTGCSTSRRVDSRDPCGTPT